MKLIYDPIKKLELLKKYLDKQIQWGFNTTNWSFDNFLLRYYPETHPESAYTLRNISTNCYYCQAEFDNKKYTPSIDHFYPRSKDVKDVDKSWLIFVICCGRCNIHKMNTHPMEFIRKFTLAEMKGETINGFSKKEVTRISKNVGQIFNDLVIGCPKKVYYKQNHWKKIPKDFILIHQ